MGSSGSLERRYAAANFHSQHCLGAKVWDNGSAQVRLVRKGSTEPDFSVRVLELLGDGSSKPKTSKLRRARREAELWTAVGSHENCVKLMEVFLDSRCCYFLTERIDHSFLRVLERLPEINEGNLARFFRHISQALAHIHSKGIVHCDVRPDNFLCTLARGRQQGEVIVKLTGFASAQRLPQQRRSVPLWRGHIDFMSPEMVGAGLYNEKTDLWSLGVVVYVLFFGVFPYREHDGVGIEQAIRSGFPGPTFQPWSQGESASSISINGRAFVKELLTRYAPDRPSALEMLETKYMQEAGDSQLLPNYEGQNLQTSLCGAVYSGAFVSRPEPSNEIKSDLDLYLNYAQRRHQGPAGKVPDTEAQLKQEAVLCRRSAGDAAPQPKLVQRMAVHEDCEEQHKPGVMNEQGVRSRLPTSKSTETHSAVGSTAVWTWYECGGSEDAGDEPILTVVYPSRGASPQSERPLDERSLRRCACQRLQQSANPNIKFANTRSDLSTHLGSESALTPKTTNTAESEADLSIV